ncbi:cadherin-like domain-containing protein [bacterium]|nr:cadherin-like domain-containing protein [bacterium]
MMRDKIPVLMLLCLCGGALAPALARAGAAEATQTIRVFRVGSSSFSIDLMDNAKQLVEAAGDYTLEYDSASYTRLDDFVTKPYLLTEWTNQYLPVIRNGNYDYVIFQTIAWFNLKPEQHALLLTEIMPMLVSNINLSGAQVLLYDKYVELERDEPDPLARAWAGRYPEGVYLNNLLHILCAKSAGVAGVSFGGGAVHELWDDPYFDALDLLYITTGHPGPMANFLSACDLCYLITGVVPTGDVARAVPMSGWTTETFNDLPFGDAADQALYAANSNRVHDGFLYLRDNEMATLQATAAKWHLPWAAALHSNLTDDAVFATTTSEIARIHAQMTNYAAYNLSAAAIEKLTARYTEAAEGTLTEAEIQSCINQSRSWNPDVRDAALAYLTPAQTTELRNYYLDYWLQRNSKFRDDVFFESLCYFTLVKKGTNAAEVTRMEEETAAHLAVLSLAAYARLLEMITPAQRDEVLAGYSWGARPKRHSPLFGQAQMAATGDWQRLVAVWNAYFKVWDDPELMDRLKAAGESGTPYTTNSFLKIVWLEADSNFVAPRAVVADMAALTVPENGANAFALRLDGPPAAGVTISVNVARVSASDCDIVVTSGAPCQFTSANWDVNQAVTLAALHDAGYSSGSAVFRCTPSDGGTMLDVAAYEIDDDNLAPHTPANLTPADGAASQPLTPVLQASAFSDPNPGDIHAASQWQTSTNAAFADILWDSGPDGIRLTSITLPPLAAGRRHYWRVRYCDAAGLWSSFSTPTWLETDPLLNNPPVAVPDMYGVAEGGALQVAAAGVLTNDTDADGDALTAVRLSDPAHGALILNADGSFIYTPATNWPGYDSFTYCASDGRTNSNSAVCHFEAQRVLICDYFEYGGAPGLATEFTTAVTNGWGANAWSPGAGDSPRYLATSTPAFYSTNSAGTAFAESAAYSNCYKGGQFIGFGTASIYRCTLTRALSPPLGGTVWVSLIVTSTYIDVSASAYNGNVAQLEVNGDDTDRFGLTSGAGADEYRWQVRENGPSTNGSVPYARNVLVLLVAKLETDYSGVNDRLTIWTLNSGGDYPRGRTVADLGPPRYTGAGDEDIWGSSISSIGLYLKSRSSTRTTVIDSLRISHIAMPDDLHVYEVLSGEAVPEPASLGLLALAGLALAARRKHGTAARSEGN